ncbi:hypothetical protein [Streptomyces sp. NPDC094032]|uniref:hypothetical protein n=1 Tax=Streptomyces sp. NPDC094032 TaxID=3155308 RepID=UPI003321E537
MTVEQWPEGPAADQDAARQRYASDMRATREALRESVRADLPAAHLRLGIVAVASLVVAWLTSPVAGIAVAGLFAALLIAVLTVLTARGVHVRDAWRRSYLFTFGWANWL